MMKRIFEDSVIKRKFLILISIIVLINACSLALWYNVRIKPTFIHNDYIRREIETKEIKKEYESIEKLELELKRISKKYETRFSVLDDNQKTVIEVYVKNTDFFLFSDVVKVDDEMFIITAYLHRDFSVASMVLSMIFFQIFVIFVLMTSTFYATGKTIINPIQRIVNDIRAYKFGKKPVRNEVSTELDIIQNEFVNLVDSLEEEKREQNRIIASISHDIKTPLTSIISYSDLLDDDSLSREEIVKYSVKINEKAHHIKNILGTFDEYLTSYDNKKLKLDDILVKDIVSDLITDYKVELESKNIKFTVDSKCNVEVVKVDVLKLKRVFSNIISNSIRYVPRDKGHISVNIFSDDGYVYFQVSDNGPGIDEKIINKVFDPFFTTDQSRKISGLGLSICKEFVEMLGGNINLYNQDGLVVSFSIPISYLINVKKKKTRV
ncbi:MAG: HAMP domain-containing sensor histidine kinase [Mycoplasmatota bacterium]|nr:HAMP domain-containing sensor histidine kinase [Mycoplasmatota bacterium]